MKKISVIWSLVLAIILSLGTITAFASGTEIEEIPYTFETEDIYGNENINEMLDNIFGEFGEELVGIIVLSSVCLLLFVPVLIVMIVFIVLNSKTKKKIKEFQKFQTFFPVNPVNVSGIFSQTGSFQNPQPVPQPVNVNPASTGTNMGNVQNTIPQNNKNEQGGQF